MAQPDTVRPRGMLRRVIVARMAVGLALGHADAHVAWWCGPARGSLDATRRNVQPQGHIGPHLWTGIGYPL